MRALPMPTSRRALPTLVALCFQARPPTSANTLPRRPRNGARRYGQPTSRWSNAEPRPTFHNVSFRESRQPQARSRPGREARPAEDRCRDRTEGAKAACEGRGHLEGGEVARDWDWHGTAHLQRGWLKEALPFLC